MTCYYSPNFKPLEGLRDTRPVFLGGNYKSKIEAESKVAKYIKGIGEIQNRVPIMDMTIS